MAAAWRSNSAPKAELSPATARDHKSLSLWTGLSDPCATGLPSSHLNLHPREAAAVPSGVTSLRMETRRLGTQGLAVGAIGLGCMGMSEFYGRADEGEAIATIHRA